MCGDANYTAGLAATVTMQSQSYFDAHLENAFASCSGPCKAAAIGGFVGSDLFNFWEAAIKKAAEKHKNVTVVVDQPGNFDPATALRVMQDGLRAHPDIQVAVSPWDDETRGIAQAIDNSGKKAGTDVRIYSIGATKNGVEKSQARYLLGRDSTPAVGRVLLCRRCLGHGIGGSPSERIC